MSDKRVALIDADIVAYRLGAMLEDESEWKIVKFEIDQYLMNTILKPIFATHYMGFFTGNRNFRKELTKPDENGDTICKPYKGGRSDVRPFWHLEIRKYLEEAWGFGTVHGMEADDAIALCQRGNSYICSNDHDFDQVFGWHYDFTVRGKREPIWISKEEAHYNFWKQMITGCNTDEVEGISMYGEARASAYLADFKPEQYPAAVKQLYQSVKKWGMELGSKKFQLTYDLLRLRSRHDPEYETYNFTLPALIEVPTSIRAPLIEKEDEDEF